MTRQERAIELRKRGYSPTDIAHIVGWDPTTALRFFSDPEIKSLIQIEVAVEIDPASVDPKVNEDLTPRKELDNLDDRLASLENAAITNMFSNMKSASIMEANKVFDAVARRRTELAKQTGTHVGAGHEKDMGRVVVIDMNSFVADRLRKAALQINDFKQVTEVDGRALQTMDRHNINQLIEQTTKVNSLDAIEASFEEV